MTEDSLIEEPGVTRVRGLAHCDVMLQRLAASEMQRKEHDQNTYQSAATAHLRQQGHSLAFGCCKAA
jgi:hypothetical protein